MARILLVEDDSLMVSLLKMLLEIEGYQVSIYDHICQEDILSVIEKTLPDIILMDVHLRQISGLDLLDNIRHSEKYKHTRVILSSGMDMTEKCLARGADAFLMKPYMPDELISIIKTNLA